MDSSQNPPTLNRPQSAPPPAGVSSSGANYNSRPDAPPPPPPPTPAASTPPSSASPSQVVSPAAKNPPGLSSVSGAPSGINKKPFVIIAVTLILLVVGFLLYKFVFQSSLGSPVTLTYWGLWESEATLRPVLTEFETAHPNIKVDYKQQSPTEYRERLQSALSQNKGPDLFRIHNTWIPMFRNSLATVPDSVFSVSDFQSVFYPTATMDLKVGNSLFAVPLEFDGLAMYVNDELLTVAGQSVPQTWDDLRNVAVAVSKCSTEDGVCRPGAKIVTSGAALGTTENVDHWQDIVAILMLQNNVNLDHPDKPTSGPADDVINYYRSFYETYNIWEPALPSSTNQFIDGKLAIYFAPSWRVFDIKAANPNLKFSIYPLPQVPVEAERQEQPITWASYWVEAVNKKSNHSAESWELIKFLSSPDTLKKLYGQAVLSQRQFGEPYSRLDLASEIQNEPYVGVYIEQAKLARSWYLTSYTGDGPTGINSRISSAFSKVMNRSISINGLAGEINNILSEYGVSVPAPAGQ